ncbi:MAG TPA: lipase maturation factor family protein [candidate division Zixibacteria bacterium]|nr:lipase maturation factor family protein [candidate division Zixibacteria bacterium]
MPFDWLSADWLSSPDYSVSRLLIGRGLAAIYLIAFLVALRQFRPLLGEHGLLPVPRYLAHAPFRQAPSLFHLGYTDRRLALVAWAGIAVSAALVIGLPQAGPMWATMLAWAVLWVLYLSIVNVGQTFYAFGWESLLLEAGFLAIFLGNERTAPPMLTLLLFRWLAFRVELGAGLIKIRGDRCWRRLTCLDYHHQTQPMPNPFSWWFHHLPRPLHRVEVLGNHVAQLVMPFGLLLPQPFAVIAAGWMILTQLYLVGSGNYAWLNWLTIVALLAAVPDGVFAAVLPIGASALPPAPAWFHAGVIGLTLLVAYLSRWPVRNLLGRRQLMNYSFNPFHIVNTYGAFGSVTRERDEVVLEGTDAPQLGPDATWREYEFKGKPGDPSRRPPQVAPYHLRLDWLMWFLPLSPAYGEGWFMRLVEALLRNDPAVIGLLRTNPFPDQPPRAVRARLYRYRYTTWRERRQTGAWWVRHLVGEFLPPVRLDRI